MKHHEAGYSGISAAVRVIPEKLNALYDLDMKIYENLTNLKNNIEQMVADSLMGRFDLGKYNQVLEEIVGIHDLDSSRNRILYGGI